MARKKAKTAEYTSGKEEIKLRSFHLLEGTYLMYLKPNVKFCLHGSTQLSVYQGCCYIYGCEISPKSGPIFICSLDMTGVYFIKSGINLDLGNKNSCPYFKDETILLIQFLSHDPLKNCNIENISPSSFVTYNGQLNVQGQISLNDNINKLLLSSTFKTYYDNSLFACYNYKLRLSHILSSKSNYSNLLSYSLDMLPRSFQSDGISIMNENIKIFSQTNNKVKKCNELSNEDDIQILEPIPSDNSSVEIIEKPMTVKIADKENHKETNYIDEGTQKLTCEPDCRDKLEQYLFSDHPNIDEIDDSTQSCHPKTLVCGKQGVGKSTLARYIVNKTLSFNSQSTHSAKASGIIWLECDVGQPEFHPAGLISLVHVTNFVLSPSWLHQSPINPSEATFKILEARYYGYNTPSHDPITYLKIINNLYQSYEAKYSDKYALVVNTNGWFKGLGFYLLCQVITMIRPTLVIHVVKDVVRQVKNGPRNGGGRKSTHVDILNFIREDTSFKTFLRANQSYFDKEQTIFIPETERSSFKYIIEDRTPQKVERVNDYLKWQKMQAPNYRTLTLMSYFADTLASGRSEDKKNLGEVVFYPGCLLACKPHQIPFEQIDEICLACPTDFPAQADITRDDGATEEYGLSRILGKLVGLCHLVTSQQRQQNRNRNALPSDPSPIKISPEINPHHTCLGLGIVRNIDLTSRILYVVSPISPRLVPNLNYVVKGAIDLPKLFKEIYLDQGVATVDAGAVGNASQSSSPKQKMFEFLSLPVKTKRNDPKRMKKLLKKNNEDLSQLIALNKF